MFAWIGFSSSILWIGLILVSIYLYGPSDLQNIPDLVLGFSNRRDLVMNILFYSFWLGVIYWPARLASRETNLCYLGRSTKRYLEQLTVW